MIRRPPRSPLFPYTTLSRSNNVTRPPRRPAVVAEDRGHRRRPVGVPALAGRQPDGDEDRKSTRLNSSHANISYAVFCLKKKKIFSLIYLPLISDYTHDYFHD